MRPLPRTVTGRTRHRSEPATTLHQSGRVATAARREHGAALQATAVPHSSVDRERTRRRCPRAEVEHPTSRVAVEGGRRATNHVHPADRLEVEPIERRLPIGKRERNPIAQHAHAAYPERRARAEASNGDPWVLRRIRAILHLHAGDAEQQIADTATPQRRAVFDRGARPGEGQFERRTGSVPRDGDTDALQGLRPTWPCACAVGCRTVGQGTVGHGTVGARARLGVSRRSGQRDGKSAEHENGNARVDPARASDDLFGVHAPIYRLRPKIGTHTGNSGA